MLIIYFNGLPYVAVRKIDGENCFFVGKNNS